MTGLSLSPKIRFLRKNRDTRHRGYISLRRSEADGRRTTDLWLGNSKLGPVPRKHSVQYRGTISEFAGDRGDTGGLGNIWIYQRSVYMIYTISRRINEISRVLFSVGRSGWRALATDDLRQSRTIFTNSSIIKPSQRKLSFKTKSRFS